jgi:hypothetical protein
MMSSIRWWEESLIDLTEGHGLFTFQVNDSDREDHVEERRHEFEKKNYQGN